MRIYKTGLLLSALTLSILIISCEKILPSLPEDDQILDGPVEGLTGEQKRQFIAGDIAFNDDIFTPQNGLGPYFVATSCGSCHAGDGKGHPFTTLTRFGQADSNGNMFMTAGGPQLQNRAIPGFTPEELPVGAAFSKITPPANTGLGLLEALTDAQILSYADPNDMDGDGISGRPNYITAPFYFQARWYHQTSGGKYIGRFGKKAAAIDLMNQTVNAYVQDMGITSEYAYDEPSIYNSTNQAPDNVPDPEISSATVKNVVFYLRTLKAPVQRNQDNPEVIAGKEIFMTLNCKGCHIPEWTSPKSDIVALSFKTFYPYTDLLLHDMGPALDDGYTEGIANTSEWKTPALWGLGLSKNSQGGNSFLMHDGRATSIQDAILLHGGEAENSKNAFLQLNETEKEKLIKFLESL